jgi:tRNA (guanine10-N2)-dimethyltransferase
MNKLYYAKIAMDLPLLAEDELNSILNSYGYIVNSKMVNGHFYFFETREIDNKVLDIAFKRAGLIFEIGEIIDLELLNIIIKGNKILVWEDGNISDETVKLLHNAREINQYGQTDLRFRVFNINETKHFGKIIYSEKFHAKRIKKLKYVVSYPTVLPNRLIKAMINLAYVKEGNTILDPFVGTARILMEASLIGIKGLGIDVDLKMITLAEQNIALNDLPTSIKIKHGNAMRLENINEPINGIVTDPPYGKSSSLKGVSIKELYTKSLESMSRILEKNKYCIMIFPDETLIELASPFFSIKDIYPSRVHKSLTRYITRMDKL